MKGTKLVARIVNFVGDLLFLVIGGLFHLARRLRRRGKQQL